MLGASDPGVFALLRPPANFCQPFGLYHETFRFCDETFRSCDETLGLHDGRCRFYDETLKLCDESFGLNDETFTFCDEILGQEAVDDSGDVVEGHEKEQADDHDDAELLDRVRDARADRAAADGLDAEEHELAAVEQGQG